MEKVTEKIKEVAATVELAKQAPILLIFACFTCGVLYFMERRDAHWQEVLKRDDAVANLRIEQCHTVQAEATEAMTALALALKEQTAAFTELSIMIRLGSRTMPPVRDEIHGAIGN